MQKSQISIVSAEGRQVSVHWDFKKVIKIEITGGVLNLYQTKMPVILKIIEFAHHHSFNPRIPYPEQPLKSYDISHVVSDDWNSNFFKTLNIEIVVEMISACDYIGFKSLSELCQAYVATIFKSMNIEELRDLFKVEKEYTDDEENTDLYNF